eukprot:136531-Prymnesium_polylepis.1
MHLAAEGGHKEVLDMLLHQKITVPVAPRMQLSKSLRAKRDWLEAPLLHIKDGALRTPLHVAAQHGHSDCIHAMLSLLTIDGAPGQAPGSGQGDELKRTESRKMSLHSELQALLNARDEAGRTPLVLAVLTPTGRQAVATLIQWGCDLDASDADGMTALMVLAEAGEASLVRLCLRAGANFSVSSPAGETAYSLAANEGHKEVLRALDLVAIDVDLMSQSDTQVKRWAPQY